MAKRKSTVSLPGELPVGDIRHPGTKRTNIPPAGIAAEGTVRALPKAEYAYNPHLPPVLRWHGPPARGSSPDRFPDLIAEAGRRPLTPEEQRLLADALRVHEPWLEWTGKRERPSFAVDPVALHIHERISAQAILKVAARQDAARSLFADPQQDYHEAVQFYKHDVDWSNRLILGDSLQVMSSLARREDLAGKVQMIYMDPPYGIKFASNFQPEVGKRDVKDRPEDLTREPEMVRAYRDTWHLGIHSYLSYLRDRLIVAKELLSDTGSIFVQISDENVHHVRALMDEVFGKINFANLIAFRTTTTASSDLLPTVHDYLIWYGRDITKLKYKALYTSKEPDAAVYKYVQLSDGTSRGLEEIKPDESESRIQANRVYALDNLTSPRPAGDGDVKRFEYESRPFVLTKGTFKTDERGLRKLSESGRLGISGSTLRYKRFLDDFSVKPFGSMWTDTSTGSFTDSKVYVVQTGTKVIERCLLMTTDPGDLVMDPTCGSGTTAYVAEQWGRRWITADTSRVAIAIARQRVLTAKFDAYRMRPDPRRGPDARADDARIPADGGRSPADGGNISADGGGISADGGRIPADGGRNPADGARNPADGARNPTDGARNSADGANGRPVGNPANGFYYKTVPHVTLKSIAQNVALDPIFARHEPVLAAALSAANAALSVALKADPSLRTTLALKVPLKEKIEGKRSVTDADRRRWLLPPGNRDKAVKYTVDATLTGWYAWEMPFDADPDYPKALADAVTAYRVAWRAKMRDVNDCIAHSAEQEELVDQPEKVSGVTRVSGPFTVEAVQPPELTLGEAMPVERGTGFQPVSEEYDSGHGLETRATFQIRPVDVRTELEVANVGAYLDQMVRFLRADGVRFLGNRQMRWTRLEPLFESGRATPFHAEGRWTPVGEDDGEPDGAANVAVIFGPQYGPITATVVVEAMRQAHRRGYDHVVLAGFNFDAAAQTEVDQQGNPRVKLHLAHIRPDINPGMAGLLKESPKPGGGQLFTVFGQPRIAVKDSQAEPGMIEVTMEGVDVYNPATDEVASTGANKVAAWLLDGDYDGRTFCVTQAFFPDRGAWEKLQKALNGKDGPIDAERFEALSGTTSLPFAKGKHGCVAVKVIDPRGNEVMAVERV